MRGGENMEFTEEQQQYIDELIQAEQQKVADVQTQLETLQQSQQTKDDELQQIKTEMFNQKVETALKDAGLLQFKDIVNVSTEDELNEVIEKLSTAVSSSQQDFQPTGKKVTSAYDQAVSKGDTVAMIGSKLSKLFK